MKIGRSYAFLGLGLTHIFTMTARSPSVLKYGPFTSLKLYFRKEKLRSLPTASDVLNEHLLAKNKPFWTSYFVRYRSVLNDHFGLSIFNWKVDDDANYQILRTGCYPYMKYHCTKCPAQDLSSENNFYMILKILNLGIPTLGYGLAAKLLIKHRETVNTPKGPVMLYFLNKEQEGARF